MIEDLQRNQRRCNIEQMRNEKDIVQVTSMEDYHTLQRNLENNTELQETYVSFIVFI